MAGLALATLRAASRAPLQQALRRRLGRDPRISRSFGFACAAEPRFRASRSTRSVTASASPGSSSSNNSSVDSELEPPPDYFPSMSKFCRKCGSPMEVGLEDTSWRHICTNCDYIDYFNPKMVVGCVVQHQGKILLCKRGIEPCKGKWTLPAGFLELHESTADGARRETEEEVNANVDIQAPYFHLDIPVIGQSYLLFRSKLAEPFTFGCGPETLEAQLFEPEDIPFDDLAFSSITITLRHFVEDMASGSFRVHHAEIEKIRGSAPNDPQSYTLKNHMSFRVVEDGQQQQPAEP